MFDRSTKRQDRQNTRPTASPLPKSKKSEFDDEFAQMKKRQIEMKANLVEEKEASSKRKFDRTVVDGKRGKLHHTNSYYRYLQLPALISLGIKASLESARRQLGMPVFLIA